MQEILSEKIKNNPGFLLPQLPSLVRYWDDFDNEYKTLRNLESNQWTLTIAGSRHALDFEQFHSEYRVILKTWVVFGLGSYAPATVANRFEKLSLLSKQMLDEIFSVEPIDFKGLWIRYMSDTEQLPRISSIKALVFFFCEVGYSGWDENLRDYLRNIPNPHVDKFASLRTGEAFLSVEEEQGIVSHLDLASANPSTFSVEALQNAALLCCSFQFGMRPSQIASLKNKDVRIWHELESPSVHLSFRMAKQRSRSESLPLPRKVKSEWAPIFINFESRRPQALTGEEKRFFNVASVDKVAKNISELTKFILGVKRSATQLRHSAAMRLVDAGATKEELAEFMGHSDLDTGLVYYSSSQNQAERVNAALGISTVYKTITKIAHNKFISPEELRALKGAQQIAGAPHGIAIAGIGGCTTGQPQCPYNPVSSCYSCPKFMPVNELAIHENVLKEYRGVVNFFEKSSRADNSSPAYMQLKHTISKVKAVLTELGAVEE